MGCLWAIIEACSVRAARSAGLVDALGGALTRPHCLTLTGESAAQSP